MDWLSIGKVASVVVAGIAAVTLIMWIIRRIEAGGAQRQAAEDAQAKLKARDDADAKMRQGAEDFAKNGGAENAADKGKF